MALSSTVTDLNLNLGVLVFVEGENRSTRRNTLRGKGWEAMTKSTKYGVNTQNQTWATLVGGKCSHHSAIPDPENTPNFPVLACKLNMDPCLHLPKGWIFKGVCRKWNCQYSAGKIAKIISLGTESLNLPGLSTQNPQCMHAKTGKVWSVFLNPSNVICPWGPNKFQHLISPKISLLDQTYKVFGFQSAV